MTTFTTSGSAAVFTTSGSATSFTVADAGSTFTVTGGAGPAGASGTAAIPTGGTARQVLAKIDATNYNTEWSTPSSTSLVLVGDATGTAASGTVTVDLSDTGVAAASYGAAGSVATFTVDAEGRLTAAANTAIAVTAAQVAGTAVVQSLADAKGDIIAATGADTWTRLAIGVTNNHVLTVDSSTATGMKWAAVTGGSASSSSGGDIYLAANYY
jgi:hypothetical protein